MLLKRSFSFFILLFIFFIFISIFLFLYQNQELPLSFYFQKSNIIVKTCNTCKALNETVYIAASEEQQTRGMMFRNSFEGAYGMLFVMNSSEQVCMWMENTKIPLEQIWINTNGDISFIKNAVPYSTNITCAQGAYVLEVPYNTVNSSGSFSI